MGGGWGWDVLYKRRMEDEEEEEGEEASQRKPCLRGVIMLRTHRASGGSILWFIHTEAFGVRFAFLCVWSWY